MMKHALPPTPPAHFSIASITKRTISELRLGHRMPGGTSEGCSYDCCWQVFAGQLEEIQKEAESSLEM